VLVDFPFSTFIGEQWAIDCRKKPTNYGGLDVAPNCWPFIIGRPVLSVYCRKQSIQAIESNSVSISCTTHSQSKDSAVNLA